MRKCLHFSWLLFDVKRRIHSVLYAAKPILAVGNFMLSFEKVNKNVNKVRKKQKKAFP